jgi:hypothetical protein
VTVNEALADILDRQAVETESEQLLAALVDGGVFVPTDDEGSVLFLQGEHGEPVLPGYVSEACCTERLPQAAASVHCDWMRIADILKHTGVAVVVAYSRDGWARVPAELLFDTMSRRGRKAEGERLKLTRTTHPVAVALLEALNRRVPEFPAIKTVWVSHARWLDTGHESLMLHIAVDEPLPSTSAHAMMKRLMDEDVPLTKEDPRVAMIALHTDDHADAITELDVMGLDTVRRG